MKSFKEWADQLVHKQSEHAYDGVITHVFSTHVQVRLKGSHRRIVSNVAIADHIDKKKLEPGRYCKVSGLFDRGQGRSGRFILTDILPIPVYEGISIFSASARPNAPIVTATLDCTESAWYISWSASINALSYQLYVAQDANGLNATLLVDTTSRSYAYPLGTDGFVFFAVKSIGSSGDSGFSNWVSDNRYFTDTGIVAFGDDAIHGDLISSKIRFKVTADGVFRSENYGVSWPFDVTPTAVFYDWGDTVDLTEVEFSQVIATDGLMFTFGKWENLSVEKQGWFWSSADNGATWSNHTLRWNAETEAYPVWASLGDTDLFIVIWADDELILHQYLLTDIASGPTAEISLGAATLVQIEAKELYAFPVWTATDEVYIAGRFTSPDSLDIAHIVKFDASGVVWTDVINDWGAGICTALAVEVQDTDRVFYATAEIDPTLDPIVDSYSAQCGALTGIGIYDFSYGPYDWTAGGHLCNPIYDPALGEFRGATWDAARGVMTVTQDVSHNVTSMTVHYRGPIGSTGTMGAGNVGNQRQSKALTVDFQGNGQVTFWNLCVINNTPMFCSGMLKNGTDAWIAVTEIQFHHV